ncbi:Eco57I restriction-modification methylase domain-containing protein [Undibacterium sp. WLHG33]|uniref:Eco57I restriction-modification methylase domain-containing protein n=1 Tax=Undibacterium sp. WLHG33 TaxID=3412482 RepID=UPI003C2C5033
MRQALDKNLRNALERIVVNAREVAEQAVREAITRLGVAEPQAPSYLDDAEKQLRVKLRAHARQLGDMKYANDTQDVDLLIAEAAYEHWHRMLFARFLEQNNLLMFDAVTPLTLDECAELANEEGLASPWAYAAQLASKMLPQVFRQDSPIFQLNLALEHIRDLENKIASIAPETFQTQDALGWVYQFWQTKRKQDVNDSGVKIGAKELSPVTQLFTEPYMVSFLLDNALGAWWANKRLSANDIATAKTEQDLRERAALPGVPLSYLRFVANTKEGELAWQPAAGKFEQWPQHLSELKTLDPCCGSGHFLVAAFLMLVPMRMALEKLSAQEAVDAVLRQNIHGLELDQRCVELAAFALALEAWRYPDAGGYRALPELHIACTGLSVKAAKAEWKALGIQLEDAGGKKNLAIALDWLHQTFADAPVLGSLINPRKSDAAKIVQWDELSAALNQALSLNADGHNDERHEAGIVAQGLAKAATLLASEFSWVITNVPYLTRAKQDEVLMEFCDKYHFDSKNELAYSFTDRCIAFCNDGGVFSAVLPQNFLYMKRYVEFRKRLIEKTRWKSLARLGARAFDSITGEVVNVCLLTLQNSQIGEDYIRGLELSKNSNSDTKKNELIKTDLLSILQRSLVKNDDSVFTFRLNVDGLSTLEKFATCYQGLRSGDANRFIQEHWETSSIQFGWEYFQTSSGDMDNFFVGCSGKIFWENGIGSLARYAKENREKLHDMHESGNRSWGKPGVAVGQMTLRASHYSGVKFDNPVAVMSPINDEHLLALVAFLDSDEFRDRVKEVNRGVYVTNGALLKVKFDLEYWLGIASEMYPNGFPHPYTSDIRQWIFHGHPCGAVIWHEQDKVTALGALRRDDSVMQVALARLLGYQWPAELDPELKLADEQRHWVKACAALSHLVDDDGIACIPAVRGEKPAADRLEAMLQAAYGEAWNINVLNELLAAVGAVSVEAWLRDKFFEQHCKMFGHRPFIWQVWDGLKDGFSAVINYHKLTADNLDRLIYTYLGDWIRTQEQGVKDKKDGADIRLAAALNLKTELEKIKEGEPGYDIFVRWKPLHEQPIGWNPDLNDGVRLNIRPFMSAKDMGKKGAGILRAKPNIDWKKDRGTDVATAPWYHLGPVYGESEGARINDHHLTRAEKLAARERYAAEVALLGESSIDKTAALATGKSEKNKDGQASLI